MVAAAMQERIWKRLLRGECCTTAMFAIDVDQQNASSPPKGVGGAITHGIKTRYYLLLSETREEEIHVTFANAPMNPPCRDEQPASGITRGWLCHSCNVGLGKFRDDPELLALAADYLRRK